MENIAKISAKYPRLFKIPQELELLGGICEDCF